MPAEGIVRSREGGFSEGTGEGAPPGSQRGRRCRPRLRGAAISAVALTRGGAALRLPASIRSQRPAPFVHFFEPPVGGPPREERRAPRLQQFMLRHLATARRLTFSPSLDDGGT